MLRCHLTATCLPLLLLLNPALLVAAEQQSSDAEVETTLPVVMVSARPIGAVESVVDIADQPRVQAQADGADYLKNVAGFSVVRKGGVDGDPLLRGAGGSRLAVLLDGAPVMGGCSNRMDPPTAYVFPDTFDRVRIIKGPQTVAYGPGVSAGAVLFEQAADADAGFSEQPHFSGRIRTTNGSFGRSEQLLQAQASDERLQLGLQANRAQMNNYRDGSGESVNSQYQKQAWQLRAAAKLSEETVLSVQAGQSEGEAAYADRGMDGSQFDRDYVLVKLNQYHLTDWWRSSEWQLSTSRVDHVMDNVTLRDAGWLGAAQAMNPRRANDKLRWHNQLEWGAHQVSVGIDAEKDRHQSRMSMNERHESYQNKPWEDTALVERQGIYGEWRYQLAAQTALVSGGRYDRARARDQRAMVGGHHMMQANPTANLERVEHLQAGFARIEQSLAVFGGEALWFVGFGQSQRLPDYWELISKESVSSASAFELPLETHRQWDAGVTWSDERTAVALNVFAANIDNYALIDSRFPKTMTMMGMTHTRLATVSRPIEAATYGLEASVERELTGNWWTQAALAYVRGTNVTDHQPLAQQPPLSAQLTLEYRQRDWQAGLVWRASLAQHRVAIGQGNIAGVDVDKTAGFATAALYGSWQPAANLTVSAGVDNLFDRHYHEHLARPVEVASALSTTRIAEPGRSVYLSVDYRF